MARFKLEAYNSFLRKRRKAIIAVWIIGVIVAGTQIPVFFSSVSYNVGNSNLGGPTSEESQVAQGIIDAQFPSSNNSGANGIIVVLQNGQMYSGSVQAGVIGLNRTLATDPRLSQNFTGMESIYTTEYSFLSSVVPSLVSQVSLLNSSVDSIGTGAHLLFDSDYLLEQGLTGINQTAQLVYGLPSSFVLAWSAALPGCGGSAVCGDRAANQTIFHEASPSIQSSAYYQTFYSLWNASFAAQPDPANPSPTVREQTVVGQAVAALSNSSAVSPQEARTLGLVAGGLSPIDWFQKNSVGNLTVTALQPEVPTNVSSSLGISLNGLVAGLISLGPSPDNATIQQFTLTLFTKSLETDPSQTGGSGLSPALLVQDSYALGSTPTKAQTWDLASGLVANASASSFSTSPLFTANPKQLGSLLSSLSGGTSAPQVRAEILDVVSNETYSEYPLIPSSSLTGRFVSPDNGTMIVVYNFSVPPTVKTLAAFQADVADSKVPSLGTYYVTGSAVLTQDITNAFGPVVGITVVLGVLASLAIVGVLLLAPLAALVPVLVGGIAIAIALPSIYYGVAVIGHGTLTFLTPALTILVSLGLTVDYSVLQLRRTKEERTKGRTTEESVSISVRWAGQAVLTAGITVVVAYIIMAVANVPLFSGVGTAIAIAVSILILAALTLLPALELTLKDRLFWPGLNGKGGIQKPKASRLSRLGEKTLRRKVAIVVIVSALALGAFYVSQSTPSGDNMLKLLPDLPSNHGLTVITEELGSSSISPSIIVVTTPTQITYGDYQLNQTLLKQLELISSTASSVPGVTSISGPTRPYGSPFSYTGVLQLPQPDRSQYLAGMLSDIGLNNRTAQIFVGLGSDAESQAAIETLMKVESAVSSQPLLKGVSVYYGGETQSTYDNQAFLNGILPEVILVLAAAVYVILLIQLRSVFTPIRLVLTILSSVAFSLAALALVYFYAQGLPILNFAPLFVVVTMLGVGIDYDIFFVTRIREEVLNGSGDEEAIKTALNKVWVTIFGLGLVLATVFTSLILTGIALLGEIGFVVAAAVMIDVGMVILFFVPALMGVAERFNWWPTKIAERGSRSGDESKA
ncbi:MAG: MMPL family transporter [Nitrososphaerales archaeon]